MARPLRLEFAGAVYHLTSRGNARQKVFFTDSDCELFSKYSLRSRQSLRLDLPRLLLDGQSLSFARRNAQGQSLHRHAPAQRHLYSNFKPPAQTGRPPVSRPVQGDLDRKGISSPGALPLYRPQSSTDQRQWQASDLEMEQLPGYGWTGFRADVFEHRLDSAAIRSESLTSAETVPGICQRRIGESALGRVERANLLG